MARRAAPSRAPRAAARALSLFSAGVWGLVETPSRGASATRARRDLSLSDVVGARPPAVFLVVVVASQVRDDRAVRARRGLPANDAKPARGAFAAPIRFLEFLRY